MLKFTISVSSTEHQAEPVLTLKLTFGEPTAQRALWEGLSFTSTLSSAAMETGDVPLAEMPGHLASSVLSKRRLEQDASLDPILVLGKGVCPSPHSAQPHGQIFHPHSVCTQHISGGETRPDAFWQMLLSPELPAPGSAGSRAQPLPDQSSIQHKAFFLSFRHWTRSQRWWQWPWYSQMREYYVTIKKCLEKLFNCMGKRLQWNVIWVKIRL